MTTPAVSPDAAGMVVLIHGLARSHRSMEKIAASLRATGLEAHCIDYPSTKHPVEMLVDNHVLPAILDLVAGRDITVHFVTHSMGGIVLRQLEKRQPPFRLGRVVMIAPPNQGTALVDRLGGLTLFRWLYGPAGAQLGSDAQALPQRLGATNMDVGVIAGTRSINPVFSWLIPGEDDGRVAVASTPLPGMRDFIRVHASHFLIMNNAEVMRQTARYLQTGAFEHRGAASAAGTP